MTHQHPGSQQTVYGFLGIILGSFLIGLSPIFVRYCKIDPLAIGFFRFFFALPFLWIWFIIKTLKEKNLSQQRLPKSGKDYLWLALAGVMFAIDIAIWHSSLLKTTVMNSTLLNNMTPVFVTLISWLVLKEKLVWKSVVGIVLAVIGTYLLNDWLPLIGLAIVVHVLGQTLIAISLKHLSATFSSLTMMIIPVVSTVFAWILFNESFTLLKIIGGMIIFTGIIIARQNEK